MVINFIQNLLSSLGITYINTFEVFNFTFYTNSILCLAFLLINFYLIYLVFRYIKSRVCGKE